MGLATYVNYPLAHCCFSNFSQDRSGSNRSIILPVTRARRARTPGATDFLIQSRITQFGFRCRYDLDIVLWMRVVLCLHLFIRFLQMFSFAEITLPTHTPRSLNLCVLTFKEEWFELLLCSCHERSASPISKSWNLIV